MTFLAFVAGALTVAAAIAALLGWLSRQIDQAVELPRPVAKPRQTAPVLLLPARRREWWL